MEKENFVLIVFYVGMHRLGKEKL